MHLNFFRHVGSASCQLFVLATLLFTGCANKPPPLYEWGNYQNELHDYFANQGSDPAAQLAILSKDLQRINASDKKPPPGFHAHLGLLYLKLGQLEQMQREFSIEKNIYPESSTYMDFLSKNFKPAPPKIDAAPTPAKKQIAK